MRCEDCGTRYSNGLCPNCHEEAFILETQGAYVDWGRMSREFWNKACEQADAAEVARAKHTTRNRSDDYGD